MSKKDICELSEPRSEAEHGVVEEEDEDGKGMRDVAADLFLETQQYSPAELEAERAAVKRKLDQIIMPIVQLPHPLQMTILIPDLGLTGHRYSWVAAIFNFGYLFWAIPANLLIQRYPVAKFTGGMIVVWSVLLCCHAAVKNYAGMLVIRFLLGMFEAGISPAIMNIVSVFYTRAEQPLRMCVFLAFNGMATMVGALLGYGLGHAHGTALKSWQLIFLVIGVLNFVWGWIFVSPDTFASTPEFRALGANDLQLLVMPDSPSNARFLTHKQRVIAIDRVASNMIGVKTKQYRPKQAMEACLDTKVHCLVLIGLACGVINGG
ncbi:hypothetical protein LTR28_008560, partial [Elasticomyces elasticus]